MSTVNSLSRLLGDDFQKFVSVLLCCDSPDFQAVDGSGGDKGNDGFFRAGDRLFQVYAPSKPTLRKLKTKIDDSIRKARLLRRKQMKSLKEFVLVTPTDLGHEANLHLQQQCSKARLLGLAWGESHLLGVLSRHPEVKSEFPEFLVPDLIAEVRTVALGRLAPEKSKPRFEVEAWAHDRMLGADGCVQLKVVRPASDDEIRRRTVHRMMTDNARARSHRSDLEDSWQAEYGSENYEVAHSLEREREFRLQKHYLEVSRAAEVRGREVEVTVVVRNVGTRPAKTVQIDVSTPLPVEVEGENSFEVPTLMQTRDHTVALRLRFPKEPLLRTGSIAVQVLCEELEDPIVTTIAFQVVSTNAGPFDGVKTED